MTILGLHTVSELRDLLLAKDPEAKALVDGFASFKSTWQAKDKPASDAWNLDNQDFQKRYADARKISIAKINMTDNAIIRPDRVPAEIEWRLVMTALQKNGENGPVVTGDVADLVRRFRDAGGELPSYVTPQPVSPDADLNAANQAGHLLGQIDPSLGGSGQKGLSVLEKAGIALAVVGTIGVVGYTLSQAAYIKNTFAPRRE